jgi:hypothetical protein
MVPERPGRTLRRYTSGTSRTTSDWPSMEQRPCPIQVALGNLSPCRSSISRWMAAPWATATASGCSETHISRGSAILRNESGRSPARLQRCGWRGSWTSPSSWSSMNRFPVPEATSRTRCCTRNTGGVERTRTADPLLAKHPGSRSCAGRTRTQDVADGIRRPRSLRGCDRSCKRRLSRTLAWADTAPCPGAGSRRS